nr:cyclic lactone autoinducer peptide [uncultured Blautia sp.]
MKEKVVKMTGKAVKTLAKIAVKTEVNSTCPFAVYQPKLPKSVENMREK